MSNSEDSAAATDEMMNAAMLPDLNLRQIAFPIRLSLRWMGGEVIGMSDAVSGQSDFTLSSLNNSLLCAGDADKFFTGFRYGEESGFREGKGGG